MRRNCLHRHEAMLFARPLFLLKTQHFQGLNQTLASLGRPNRRVGELFRQRFKGAVEAILKLGNFLGPCFRRIGGLT